MVEPIFRLEDLRVTQGSLATYDQRSEGSGKLVHVHFCQNCEPSSTSRSSGSPARAACMQGRSTIPTGLR